ncbi:MAG: NADH-quinone oxidoreductase subunit M [Planctomycetes bacterium]|nr:NADH-quinone oxidoreductase subunit M [Planctomycetota bacterium]MBI3846034.1 NADH-quinone oxidoreductase subunit M [Planctomycetota bacterium]
MNEGFPFLSALLVVPAIGAFVLIAQGDRLARSKWIAFGFALAELGIAVALALRFDSNVSGPQAVERHDWIPSFGIHYHLGIDGLSFALIVLTTFLTAVATLASFRGIATREREFYALLLLLEAGTIGVFVSLDLFLFYVFWEVMLLPMVFLIGIFGHGERVHAATKFFLYTLAGSLFMLIGLLTVALYYHAQTGNYSFDARELAGVTMPENLQRWAFLALFVGFAVKVPLFPLHTWLPDAHTEAPTAGSVMLAAILLKMGVYGFLRIAIPLLPAAATAAAPWVGALAIVGIVYGAIVAMSQPDMKRLVAYSSISHLGFVVLGVFAFTPQSLDGALLQMVNHGLSTGALFLIVGMIYERRHTREIAEFGGLAKETPVLATFLMIASLSSIGLPGLNGFVGEFLILIGVFRSHVVWAIAVVLGIVLGAAYLLTLYRRVIFGKVTNPKNRGMQDLTRREIVLLAPIVALMLWIGLYPGPVLRTFHRASESVLMRVASPSQANAGEVPTWKR